MDDAAVMLNNLLVLFNQLSKVFDLSKVPDQVKIFTRNCDHLYRNPHINSQAKLSQVSSWLADESLKRLCLDIDELKLIYTFLTVDHEIAVFYFTRKEPLEWLKASAICIHRQNADDFRLLVEKLASLPEYLDLFCYLLTAFCDRPSVENFANALQENLLHITTKTNNIVVVKSLSEALNIEALAKAKDINGNTPLHLAIAKKYLPIVEILLPYFSLQDLSEPNRAGLSLIDALLENFPEQFKDLIKLIRTPPESSIKNSHVLLGPVGSTAPPKTEKHCCIS